MEIIKCNNLGFCSGVKNSIELALNQTDGTLLGHIVHNKEVTTSLTNKGIKIVSFNDFDDLNADENPTIIISAHGLSLTKKNSLAKKGLNIIDTTCPLVSKAHKMIISYIQNGYDIIYFAKKKHHEALAISEDYPVHLIETITDLKNLKITNSKVALATLTTTNIFELDNIIDEIKYIYPQIIILPTICPVTKSRQEELFTLVKKYNNTNTAVIIVGDVTSNNTQMLVNIVRQNSNLTAFPMETEKDLQIQDFKQVDKIIVASGTSTPMSTIDKIINKLSEIRNN